MINFALNPDAKIRESGLACSRRQSTERDTPLTFAVLLNLASVCNAENKQVLWGFITRYAPDANPEKNKMLDSLVEFSIRYYRDFVKPKKKYRSPSKKERSALIDLAKTLEKMSSSASAEDLQKKVYKAGKDNGFDNLRDWFKACYEVLFGQEQGPRMGSFIELYGVSETVNLFAVAWIETRTKILNFNQRGSSYCFES